MPYKKTTDRTRRQRQRRRAAHVRRLEVVLNAEYEQDRTISDYLDTLPRGEISTFIRTAILEKIKRTTSAADEFNQILSELADLRKAMQQPAQPVELVLNAKSTMPSSGLDMSRPRPKSKASTSSAPPPPPTLPEVLTDQEQVDLARIMAHSIRTAQPGRSQ